MRKINIIIIGLIFILMLSTFMKIPYLSNIYFRAIACFCILIFNTVQPYFIEKIINQYEMVTIVDKIKVYKIPYDLMKSYNAMIIKGKDNIIIIEESIFDTFDSDEIMALIYHEIGHIHTVRANLIYFINIVGLFFETQGFHEMIYNDVGYVYVLVGSVLIIISQLLKRYIEIEADKYAILMGCNKEKLISALERLENMNKSKSKIVLSDDHPSLKRRIHKMK